MMNKRTRRHRALSLVLVTIIFAALACNAPITGPAAPEGPAIPVSTEAVESLEQQVQEAVAAAQAGQTVTVAIDEAQFTSLIAFELQNQPDMPLQNPQVLLRDGQVQVFGDVEQNGITLPLKMALNVSVDTDGVPHYEVAEASLGPLPLPQDMLGSLTTQLDTAFANEMATATNNMFIESVTIGDGVMQITGRQR